MDDEARRKLQAKRFNEHVKLLVTTINAIALVIFAAAVLQPLIGTASGSDMKPVGWPWVMVSAILHLFAHGVIRLIRAE